MGRICVVAASADADPETWRYVYSPTFPLSEAGWAEMMCWKCGSTIVLEDSVWRVADWWTTTVPRNRRWWAEVGQPAYETFWDAVDKARVEGTHVYKPKCLIEDEEDNKNNKDKDSPRLERHCLIESDTDSDSVSPKET